MLGYYSQVLHKTMDLLEEDVPICDDAFNCLMFVVNMGLRAGGGVGEPLI